MPVKQVVLFSSGVGYFEHFGTVHGEGSTELRFKSAQINDILKSLVLQDLDKGRVEAVTLPGGLVVQAGGEVFGHDHWAYRELVEELGLTIEPSYVADPGEMSWGLVDGVFVGDEPPWMSERERADARRIGRHAREPRVDHNPHAVDGDGTFRNIGRKDQFALCGFLHREILLCWR